MGREVGGECIAQPAGVRRRCVGDQKCSGRACRCAGASEGLRRGRCYEVGGRASGLRGRAPRSLRVCVGAAWACTAQPAGVRRRCVGERKCSARTCRCAGVSEGLRWGMGREVGGECIAQPAGVRRRCVGDQKCSARACRCAGASGGLRWGMGCAVGGECIAQPAGVRRGCVGERKCSGRACRCAGASEGLRRGMGREVGGFNAHSPQQVARTRIIIYTSGLSTP